MSIINNSETVGSDYRDLVLKTRGSIHVKVGNQYYELDFRNLNKSNSESEENIEKEDYVIVIENKESITTLEYPGDNKLIASLDGNLFITKNNKIIDLTSKNTSASKDNATKDVSNEILTLDMVMVTKALYGSDGLFIDFANNSIMVNDLNVVKSIKLPSNSVKNKCGKTVERINEFGEIETDEQGNAIIETKYTDLDFLEIDKVPNWIVIKSGVIIKSNVSATISVSIGNDITNDDIVFEKGGLYIIYNSNEEIIQTKLN